MAAPRSKRGSTRTGGSRPPREPGPVPPRSPGAGLVPDLLRRAIGIGVSGLFTTEEVVRKTFGDSLPREWLDFAAAQTDRARSELTERIASQIQRKLDEVGLEEVLQGLLRGHTIEVDAKIRFAPREAGDTASRFGVRVTREEKS